MRNLFIAFGALALAAPSAAQTVQPASPSIEVCQTALAIGARNGADDLGPIVDLISIKLGFTDEQKQTQRVVCAVYYAGVADGISIGRQQRDI